MLGLAFKYNRDLPNPVCGQYYAQKYQNKIIDIFMNQKNYKKIEE